MSYHMCCSLERENIDDVLKSLSRSKHLPKQCPGSCLLEAVAVGGSHMYLRIYMYH